MKNALKLDTSRVMDLYHHGDERALAYFFDEHYRSLCYFAKQLVRDSEQAKDIVSKCFINLWNAEHKAETLQNIKSFLYISCKNECFNYLRQLDTRTKLQNTYYDQLAKEEDGILSEIIRSEVLDILAKQIDLLPDKCRSVFKMIYFEHKKTEEIAVILQTNEKSVRYYKSKAIELLKSAMLKKGLSYNFCLVLALLSRR